jgi:hypothetical protein
MEVEHKNPFRATPTRALHHRIHIPGHGLALPLVISGIPAAQLGLRPIDYPADPFHIGQNEDFHVQTLYEYCIP